jgi:hypothetical protein
VFVERFEQRKQSRVKFEWATPSEVAFDNGVKTMQGGGVHTGKEHNAKSRGSAAEEDQCDED